MTEIHLTFLIILILILILLISVYVVCDGDGDVDVGRRCVGIFLGDYSYNSRYLGSYESVSLHLQDHEQPKV